MENYTDGVASIYVTNLVKHIKVRGLLDYVRKKYSGGSLSSTSNIYVTKPIGKSFSKNIS